MQSEITKHEAENATRNVNSLYLVSQREAEFSGDFLTEGGRLVMICQNHINSNCIANFISICIIIMH